MKTKEITRMALLTAIALTIFMVEAQLPGLVPVPEAPWPSGLPSSPGNFSAKHKSGWPASWGPLPIPWVRWLWPSA